MFIETNPKHNDRRRQGRRGNPNVEPMSTSLRVRPSDLDRLDRLITYSRMPLGEKFSSLLNEFEMLRKNSVGQQLQASLPMPRQELLINQWSEEEIKVMKESGW